MLSLSKIRKEQWENRMNTRELQEFALRGMIAERDALNIRIRELSEALGIAPNAISEIVRRRLDGPQKTGAGMIGKAPQVTVSDTPAPRKKRSAAVRRKMAEAQKARWAKLKAEKKAPVAKAVTKGKARTAGAGA
jgi:hypothetical protein